MKKAILLLLSVFLFSCSKPLPENKLDYAGEWKSKEMYLLILADGTVSYQRLQKGGKTSINGPLKEFQGDNFVVGAAFLTTTFEVSEVPYQEDGSWFMVVDGLKLKKSSDSDE